MYERLCIVRKRPIFFKPYAISVLYSNGLFSRKKSEEQLEYAPRRGKKYYR